MSSFREYTKYVALNVLGMIGLSCYILADTFFVSKGLGSNGLAALNLAIPIYNFIHGTGLMLGMGGATRYSMARSQGAEEQGNQIFSHTFVMVLGFSVFFLCIGLFGAEQLTQLLGADEAVFSMCKIYLQVMLLFSPAFLLNDLMICFVRNDGEPKLAMSAMLAGSFANIILDYVFIFIFHLGIFGAVFATGFAPIISMAIMSRHLLKKQNKFHLVRRVKLPQWVRPVLVTGAPSLVSEVSSGIVMLIFNMILLQIRGNIGVAAYGVIANLSLVVIAIYTGIAQGIQPLVSKYYGAGNTEQVRRIYRYAVWTIVIMSAVIFGGMFLGAEGITAIFNSEGSTEMQSVAVEGIRLYFIACGFAGYNIVLSIYFAAVDRAQVANMVSVLRGFLLIIPVTFLMTAIWGIQGLWLAFPVTEGIVTIIGFAMWRGLERENGEKG